MARASTPTLLSLDRWAQLLGVNPAHFNEAVGVNIMPQTSACKDVYWQHAWQAAGQVSREEIAQEISIAETEIAQALGYWPAPVWQEGVMVRYDHPHRREFHGVALNIKLKYKDVQLPFGKFINGGRRAVQSVGLAETVVYSDEDGDGYDETATVTVATSLTRECDIKVYTEGMNGDPSWEIRPARTKEITGGNFVATFWAWQMIDPTLWDTLPVQVQPEAENLEDPIYVADVDVYREYNDTARAQTVFFWERDPGCTSCGGTGCLACQQVAQQGCLHLRDRDQGLAVPTPATYDADAGGWQETAMVCNRDPDQIKVWYQSGDIDNRYMQGLTCEPLSDFWAQTIAFLATARLSRPLCSCNNVTRLAHFLQADYAMTSPAGDSYNLGPDDLTNPFGTKRGEIRAWRRVIRLMDKKARVAVI